MLQSRFDNYVRSILYMGLSLCYQAISKKGDLITIYLDVEATYNNVHIPTLIQPLSSHQFPPRFFPRTSQLFLTKLKHFLVLPWSYPCLDHFLKSPPRFCPKFRSVSVFLLRSPLCRAPSTALQLVECPPSWNSVQDPPFQKGPLNTPVLQKLRSRSSLAIRSFRPQFLGKLSKFREIRRSTRISSLKKYASNRYFIFTTNVWYISRISRGEKKGTIVRK